MAKAADKGDGQSAEGVRQGGEMAVCYKEMLA